MIFLKTCDSELKEFVDKCEEEYGIDFMTFNVHALRHLCDNIKMTGPLWATSAFSFESEMRHIKKSIKGSHGVVEQVSNRIVEAFQFKKKLLKKPGPSK